MIPEKIAIAVFVVVVAQLLSAVAIIILVFTAPSYVSVAVKVFGSLLAARSGFFVIYGLMKGDLSSGGWRATRASEPTRYWSRITGNLIGVGVGMFLMLYPIP